MLGKLLSGMGITQYILTGSIVLIITVGASGFWYFNYTQDKMAQMNKNLSTLKADNTVLGEKINGQNKTIDSIQNKTKEYNNQLNELNNDFREINNVSKDLVKILQEHDLNKLTLAKSKMIESRINNASDELRKRLETEYGNYEEY